jgi:hypothetical protein
MGTGAIVGGVPGIGGKRLCADLYDSALDMTGENAHDTHVTEIGALFDPAFDPTDIAGCLASWRSKRARPPGLTLFR